MRSMLNRSIKENPLHPLDTVAEILRAIHIENSDLLNKLRDVVESLIRGMENVVCVVIFGSFVKEFSDVSDVDIAVVLRDFEGLDSSHEVIDDRILEIIFIGEKTFQNMVEESHPLVLNILFNRIPLYGGEWLDKRMQMLKPEAERWIRKYLDEGFKRLGEATDLGDVISALTLILNAYLLSKGVYELSYSIDKLIKKINEEDIVSIIERTLAETDVEKARRLVEELVGRLRLIS